MTARSPRSTTRVRAAARRLLAVPVVIAASALGLAPAAAAQSDPTLAAAGDIACSGGMLVDATHCHHTQTSDLVLGMAPTAVAVLGDAQYSSGRASDFAANFDPTWGRLRDRIRPVPGNHEYRTAHAAGYFGYFGAAAGAPAAGYYAYDLGAWRVLALNSNCDAIACDGGEQASDAELAWLADDLARHPAACTLAYWHHPLFATGVGAEDPAVRPLWDLLHRSGVDVVLNGHIHDYERFAPQDPARAATAVGIRQFVVGTGGRSLSNYLGPPQPNSEIRLQDAFGALLLTLRPQGYDWRFVDERGTVRDSGTGTCHGLPQPPAAGTGPASAVAQGAATVAGTVTPRDQATSYRFEYGTTTAYGLSTPETPAGAGPGDVPASAVLVGLAPATRYHYRLVATNPTGTTTGPDATFTTLPLLPRARTDAARAIGRGAATVTGTVTLQGAPTTYRFEYGTTTAYGSSTADRPAGAGPGQAGVAARLRHLVPGTVYHYRVVAANAAGAAPAGDATFTTSPSRVTIAARRLRVRRGAVRIPLTCEAPRGARCAGTLVLTARVGRGAHRRTVVLGRRGFAVRAGRARRGVALTRHARRLLRRSSVRARIAVRPRRGQRLTADARTVVLAPR